MLEVERLEVRYRTEAGEAKAVDGVSFAIEAGMCLGLVGESGCGKSTVAKAILGILPPAGRIAGGAIRYAGRDLGGMSPADLRRIRWQHIALVPQSAMNGLDPVYTVESQLTEAITAHRRMPPAQRRRRIAELFALVGLEPSRVRDYPHQFSGGMRQRAMIAMAMALNPELLVADEPTTALDVTVQAQVLRLIRRMQETLGTAVILVTHDLGVVTQVADEVLVMYGGRVMERAGRRTLLLASHHPYTEGLLQSLPAHAGGRGRLRPIPGQPPSMLDPPPGCPFAPRCIYVMDKCQEDPPLEAVSHDPRHVSACWLPHNHAGRKAP